jgi:sulfane dehydrogenase subunit SoxC
MNAKERGRRQFLKDGAALAGLAVGATRSASGRSVISQSEPRQAPSKPVSPLETATLPGMPDVSPPVYGGRSPFETAGRTNSAGVSQMVKTPLQDLVGGMTPSGLHFVVSHRAYTPNIDPREHRLMIHGMVDRPLVLTLEELKRLPAVSRVHFLQCAGNSYFLPESRNIANAQTVQETHGATSCSEWTGVPLSLVLKEAGVQSGASWIVGEGSEGKKHTISVPITKAMDDVLLAYGQNGEALRPENGYPLRLLCPGFEGTRSVKWLRRIKVVDQPYMTKWESTIYVNLRMDGKARWFQMELEPNSVITFPSGGQRLAGRGFYEITGLAWAGGGTIRKVDISTDGGKTWKEAKLQRPVFAKAHTRFRFPWNWDGKEAVLLSRAMDEWGLVQPTLAELNKIWNVSMDWWPKTTNRVQHFNACQPWKVTPEGSVHNVIWES